MYNNQRSARELKIVDVFADVTIGATGACTLVAKNSLGVKSITRNSAGNYTVVMAAPHVRLLAVNPTFLSTAPAAAVMSVSASANVNGSTTASAPSITLQFQNGSGVATDPASGEEILLEIILANSTGA